jgi:hypothetical protein
LEGSTAARGAGTGVVVSIPDACDGVGSLVRASSSVAGRAEGGGGWATLPLQRQQQRHSRAGGGVEGTAGSGSGDGKGPPLERSTAARVAGAGAAVSIPDACDGVGSRVRASSSCGIGRTEGGGGWATSSLFAGGGKSPRPLQAEASKELPGAVQGMGQVLASPPPRGCLRRGWLPGARLFLRRQRKDGRGRRLGNLLAFRRGRQQRHGRCGRRRRRDRRGRFRGWDGSPLRGLHLG